MNVTSNPEEAVQRLLRARRVLVTSHRSPDGDALGSELALADLARSCSVEAHIVNRDPAPRGLSELPGTETIQVRPDLPAGFPCGYDLVVMVECPDLDRPGFDNLTAAPILNIDHHRSNARYGEVNFLDEEAPAAGEMVWQMFRAAGVAPSPHAATNAYVALTTDTGDFRYSNATPRAFHAAAEMVAAGARPEQVAGWIHERRSPGSIRLLGAALQTLTISCGGRLATIEVAPDAYERSQAGAEDTEDIINVPRSIAGVDIVAFFKQHEPGIVRLSLRSKGRFDVQSVAAQLGGGGHPNAAGCTIRDNLENARHRVLPMLTSLLESAS